MPSLHWVRAHPSPALGREPFWRLGSQVSPSQLWKKRRRGRLWPRGGVWSLSRGHQASHSVEGDPPGARLPPAGDEGMRCSFPAFSWLGDGGPRQILLGLDWFLVSGLPSVSVTRRAPGQPSRPTCLQPAGFRPSGGAFQRGPHPLPRPSPSVCLRLINTRLPPGPAGPRRDGRQECLPPNVPWACIFTPGLCLALLPWED